MAIDKKRIEQITEDLISLVLVEGNPKNWPGHGLLPNEMDRALKLDREAAKKGASLTVSLATKMLQLQTAGDVDPKKARAMADAEAQENLDEMLEKAQAEAQKLMENLRDKDGNWKTSYSGNGKLDS